MIINCEYCENSKECEYRDKYNRLQSKAVEFFRNADADPATHCFFSWRMSCDYFYPRKETTPCTKDERECSDAV